MKDQILELIIKLKNQASKEIEKIKKDLGSLGGTADKVGKSFDGFEKTLSKNSGIKKLSADFDSFKRSAGAVMSVVGVVGASIAGLAFNNAIKIESQMADVRKTTGLTAVETDKLREAVVRYSTTSATPIDQILGITKVAGSIGITQNELEDFTKSIDKVTVALGDEFTGGSEEVTNSLGTLKKLFKETNDPSLKYADVVTKIGSALNSLGSTGSSTSPVVADFANRIGQLGPALSPTITETLGLGAVLQELGLSAEIGAGGLSNLLLTATTKSGAFASQMGISEQAFDDLIKKSPNEMLLKLAKSFESIKDDPVALGNAMKSLGIGSQESVKVMSLLASKTDLVKERQKLAYEEFNKGTSVIDEYNVKNNTLSSVIEKAKNAFVGLSSSLLSVQLGPIANAFDQVVQSIYPLYDLVVKGDFTGGLFGLMEDSAFVDTVLTIREAFLGFVDNLKRLFDAIQNSSVYKALVDSLLTGSMDLLVASVKGVLDGLGGFFKYLSENQGVLDTLIVAITMIIAGFTAFSIVTTVIGWITAIVGAIGAIGGAITAAGGFIAFIVGLLGGPVTIIIVAIVALVAGLALAWKSNFLGIRDIVGNVVGWIVEKFNYFMQKASEIFSSIKETVGNIIENIVNILKAGWDKMMGLLDFVWNLIKITIAAIFLTIVSIFTGNTQNISVIWQAWLEKLKVYVSGFIENVKQFISGFWENLKQAFSSAMSFLGKLVSDGWTGMINSFTAFGNNIKNKVGEMWNNLKNAFTSGMNNVKNINWSSIGTSIINGILSTLTGAPIVNKLRSIANDAIRAAKNALNLTGGGGSPSGKGGTPRATGGSVGYSETTLVGENGPELVKLPFGSKVQTAYQTQRQQESSNSNTYNINLNLQTNDKIETENDAIKLVRTLKNALQKELKLT